MKKSISIASLLTVVFLLLSMIISSAYNKSVDNNVMEASSTIDESEASEMRGLWVSFISLDMRDTDKTFASFKAKFDKIIDSAKDMKCNTLVVQVRPFSDALYCSEVYPSSHILTGIQGESPSYDALEYMCKAAHKAKLQIHAWVNPYRVATNSSPEVLSKDNPYVKDNTIGYKVDSGIYLNPAKKAVRKLITDGVVEIVKKYDVDGIHFDDYFYPTDCGNFDAQDFNTYKKSTKNITKSMTIENWRQNNVNLLLSQVYRKIKEIDSSVVFGISPQGNIENNYAISADVKSWCEAQGYADYICPQMYYSTEHPVLPFEESLKEWNEFSRHKNLKVYIGLGVYKAGTDADSGTWLGRNDVLSKELTLLRKYNYDGYILYDYNALSAQTSQSELEVFRSII